MFSSNPVQQLPSSIHVFPPTSFIDHEQKDGVHFSQHHHHHHSNQFPNGDCCYIHAYNTTLAPPPPDHKTLVCKRSGFNQYSDANSCLLESVIYQSKKKMTNMKKDGHSKIHTAQGPRDRRVRMSIEVARKFFYLQDLLGFDKASKTLDWLFTNSKTAIKELVEEMKHCSSPGVTNQCEVVFQDTLSRSRLDEEDRGQNKRLTPKCVDAKKKRKYRSEFDVNQSREEARARARERTKEKIQNKKLDDVIPQSSFWRQVESKKEFSQRSTSESVVEQKVRISSSMLYGYQPSGLFANDLSSQIKYTSFLNMH